MPTNKAAVIPAKGHRLEVAETPYIKPGPNEIIIRNRAVAINPVDWKMQDRGIFIENYPSVFGCDVAGIVEEVGSDVKDFKPGDRVIGNATCLTLGPKYGSFQSFVCCTANVACKIPDDMAFEAGVVLPLAINTAGQGLFASDCLALPSPSVNPTTSDVHVLIYGGSTSNGSAGIQLAKAAGVTVVAIASKANHEFCKTLGASICFDYKETGWISKVADYLRGKNFAGTYDSIGTSTSVTELAQLISEAGLDSKIMSVGATPEGIKAKLVFGTNVTKDDALARALWSDFLPKALEKGTILPKPDFMVTGHGLESIQEAMDVQKKGVNARKVVVTID